MARRIWLAIFCVTLAVLLQTSAFARFYEDGEYTSSSGRYEFRFEPEDAAMIYYDEGHYYPYDDGIWAGSKLYVPVYCDEDDEIATMAQINDAKAGVTYKANRLVDKVELVDVPDNFSDVLDPGVHAVVTFSDDYTEVAGTNVDVRLVLTLDGVAQQRTMAAFTDTVKNRVIDLHRNSVYSATRPTVFRTDYYSGEAVFDFGDDIRYTAVVAENSRYFMKLDRSEITSLADMYKKVYLEYYDFVGENNTFVRDGVMRIPIDRDDFKPKRNANPQIYAYKYTDGALTAMGADEVSFDSRLDVLSIKTNKPETYVLSAEALLQEVDESSDEILKVGYQKDETKEPEISSAPPVSSQTPPSVEAPPPVSAEDANNPINGGDTINAVNESAENPGTSDGRVIWPVSVMAVASSGLLFKLSRKK